MKRVILGSLLATTVLLGTSCNKSNQGDFPSFYTYATVAENSVHDGDAQEDATLSFDMDNGKSFLVEESKVIFDYELLEVGERVVTGVNLDESVDDVYDYTAKLYDVARVYMGDYHLVETEAENDAIADDEFSYINKYASLAYGYFNIFVGFKTDNIDDVSYSLVLNQIDGDANDGDYLELELRFDDAVSSSKNVSAYERYVSFDMEPLSEMLEGKSGVKVRVKTSLSGTSELIVKLD